jgi:pyruvate-formate lyase-activating enzyme
MFLPDRSPVVFNIAKSRLETLEQNPHNPGEKLFPAAVFNSPGYVVARTAAYAEKANAKYLPLFSYAAVGWRRNQFVTTAFLVDRERRQDLRLMSLKRVKAGVARMRKKMPGNRLRAHLEKCALSYGCPAGKNFFLRRFEAPLPTSKSCNALCVGCISFQKEGKIPCSQNRIRFIPNPDEISEIALEHIRGVRNAIVSFGQGCEGDPLLAAGVIEPAIKKIRAATSDGTINMNTNGSMPDVLEALFDAGLDSIRISLNSVRKQCYKAYYRPKDYCFDQVLKSIFNAHAHGKFISLNYLSQPGVTDSSEEISQLMRFLDNYPINMIQWRNLNFDPLRYCRIMSAVSSNRKPAGMKNLLAKVRRNFPNIQFGYFNPPKAKWGKEDSICFEN